MSSWEPQQPHNKLLTSLKLSRQFNPCYANLIHANPLKLTKVQSNLIRNPAVKFGF